MYAEKENVTQLLVNKPDPGIQITFTISSVNLAEILDQIMECVSTLFFLPSNQLLKENGSLSELLHDKLWGHMWTPLHSRYL